MDFEKLLCGSSGPIEEISNTNDSKCVIYILHSDDSNKTYVGKSVDEVKREDGHHRACLKENNQDIHKHIMSNGGFDNWTMTILERVENPDDLQDREQFWIDKLLPSLNMRNAMINHLTGGPPAFYCFPVLSHCHSPSDSLDFTFSNYLIQSTFSRSLCPHAPSLRIASTGAFQSPSPVELGVTRPKTLF